MRNWFTKVAERDVFGTSGRAAVEAALAGCEKTLEDYAARVYAEEVEKG
ncbi:MAG: Chromate resistance protein ChrB [Streptosporangiaceae bacterium]